MLVTYDPILVVLSVILGMTGAYTCFELTAKVINQGVATHKGLLVGAALAIGGSNHARIMHSRYSQAHNNSRNQFSRMYFQS